MVFLVPFVYEVSKCCPGIFDIWSKTVHGIFQSDWGCPRGGQIRSKGCPRRGSENQVAKITLHPRKVPSKRPPNGTPNLNNCILFDYTFYAPPPNFRNRFSIDSPMVPVPTLSSFCCVFGMFRVAF